MSCRWAARGKVHANGASFDLAVVHIWELRNAQVIRYQAYMDTPGMLEVLARPRAEDRV